MKKERAGCPENERFLRVFLADPEERDKEELADHLLNCPHCGLKLSVLNSIQKEFKRLESGIETIEMSAEEKDAFRKMAREHLRELERANRRRPRKVLRLRSVPLWAVAAGLLIMAVGGFLAIRQFGPGSDAYRSADDAGLRLLEPLGRLKKAPDTFSWTPIKGGEGYFFKLIDPKLQTVFETDTPLPQVHLTQDNVNKIEKGTVYLWTITARGDLGELLAQARGTFIID